MKSILVATDMSSRSDSAIDRAVLLASQHGAALRILYVVDDEIPASLRSIIRGSATEKLTGQAAKLGHGINVKPEIIVETGTVWKTIIKVIDQVNADLVVLGPNRSQGVMDLFLGTTLDRIARNTKTPLLVVKNPATAQYVNAIVGIDFSLSSRNAVNAATAVAPSEAITLLNAYRIPLKSLTMRHEGDNKPIPYDQIQIERRMEEQMSEFAKLLEKEGKSLKRVFVEGRPSRILQSEADSRNCDLICVGAHSRSWVADAFLGSTARELLSGSPCDVLVAPL